MREILHSTFPGLIKRIEKSDRARVTVECYDGKSANKISTSKDVLSNFNLEAFVPSFRVSREGIIRNIPLDISTEDIIRFSSTSLKCPIVEARRFVHKNEKGEKFPSTTVQIKFEGQEIQNFIDLFHMRIKVDPYITQPKLCYSCFRFGHVTNQCKNPRCRFCGSSPHEKDQVCQQINGPYSCLNCKGSHLVSDKNCRPLKNNPLLEKCRPLGKFLLKKLFSSSIKKKGSLGPIMLHLNPTICIIKEISCITAQLSLLPDLIILTFPVWGKLILTPYWKSLAYQMRHHMLVWFLQIPNPP